MSQIYLQMSQIYLLSRKPIIYPRIINDDYLNVTDIFTHLEQDSHVPKINTEIYILLKTLG